MERVVTLSAPDAGELLTLQRAAYLTEARIHNDLSLPPLVQTLDELRAELAGANLDAFGLRDDNHRLVGAVRLSPLLDDPSVAELGRLVVAPDQQGRGLGTHLLHLAEERLPAAITTLTLFTGEHSADNLRLYTRHGYRETHRVPTPAGYSLIYLAKPTVQACAPACHTLPTQHRNENPSNPGL